MVSDLIEGDDDYDDEYGDEAGAGAGGREAENEVDFMWKRRKVFQHSRLL